MPHKQFYLIKQLVSLICWIGGSNSLYSSNIIISRKFNRRAWVLWKHKFNCSPLCYTNTEPRFVVWGWSRSLKQYTHTNAHTHILYESITHTHTNTTYMVKLHETSISQGPNIDFKWHSGFPSTLQKQCDRGSSWPCLFPLSQANHLLWNQLDTT